MIETWRLLIHDSCSGKENMATDEAILKEVSNQKSPPTLRFYTWEPPTVSIGYFQKIRKEINIDAVKALGYDIVRRPTGGRTVLHKEELTYSISVREDHPKVPREVVAAYKTLSEGLLNGLKTLGFSAELHASKDHVTAKDKSAACFDAPSWYELVVDNRKVIGSAQVRKFNALLQHGSIPLEFDLDNLLTVLNFPSDKSKQRTKGVLQNKACGLRDILEEKGSGTSLTVQGLIDHLTHGFEKALGIKLEVGDLTDSEKNLRGILLNEKYAHDNWTYYK